MKKITYIIAGLFFMVGSLNASAFNNGWSNQECTVEYNLYKGDIQAKNFTEALTRLNNLMENCPTLSVNIYKYGYKIAEDMLAKGQKEEAVRLYSKIMDTRIIHFPKDLGKVFDSLVNFLKKSGYTHEELFQHLDRAYKEDPSAMSAKNIYLYFEMVMLRNKDIDVQLILDTYDNINDALDEKAGRYQTRLSKLIAKEDGGATLSSKDAKSKRIAEGTLKNIGIVKAGLEQRIEELMTCERLVPLYRRDFAANMSNGQWLKRAVSRMFNKECTEDPLYEELAKAYAEADPSSDAYIFLSGILEKKGKKDEALEMRKKAIELEIDPVRKARHLLTIARDMAKKGQKSSARKYANQALASNPSYGKAYLLIASLYASSANSCGTNEFSKRMVYVAALNKAQRAASVDPSIASTARKYIKNYQSNIPSKQMAFADGIKEGDPFKIGCWIGENVKVKLK
ncbi:MAG: hypothetical protein BM563_00680 [Bacteroidetes bacterium MedPE-SWsnd-G1]|nr:MAG: hypothetical protein BM563_00680 [Bacteroidetes bacterium MedPE-SWsnd-G1]